VPLPLAPIAGLALRYGAVALGAWALGRHLERGFRDQRAEDALDDLCEGVTLRHEPGQTNGTGRFRRVVRIGTNGPGLEVDLAALARLKLRPLRAGQEGASARGTSGRGAPEEKAGDP